MDRPDRFADQKLAEERNIVFDDFENNEKDDILIIYTTDGNNITVDDDYGEIESSDEDDILDSLKEYSEENFDDFTNFTRKRRDTDKENNDDDILAEDIEVEKALEEIEPSTEMKNYQMMIRYIKNEGIEGNPILVHLSINKFII